jgi:hypothetical protein
MSNLETGEDRAMEKMPVVWKMPSAGCLEGMSGWKSGKQTWVKGTETWVDRVERNGMLSSQQKNDGHE